MIIPIIAQDVAKFDMSYILFCWPYNTLMMPATFDIIVIVEKYSVCNERTDQMFIYTKFKILFCQSYDMY